MPLYDDDMSVEAPQGKDFKPVQEDVYHVVIKDIEQKIMPKFQSEEEEAFYKFKLVILDGDKESHLQSLTAFCTRKWFSGNKKAQPSKLVSLVKAVYAFYYPNLSVLELEAEDMTKQVINDLVGKQLRVNVKFNNDATGNRVTDFMTIKKELEVPEEANVAKLNQKYKAAPAGVTKESADSPVKEEETAKEEEKDEKSEKMPF